MKDKATKFAVLVEKIIGIISIIILFFLTVDSLLFTCTIDANEKIARHRENIILLLSLTFLFLAISYFLKKYINVKLNVKFKKIVFFVILALNIILSISIILLVGASPRADQGVVVDIVESFYKKDYSSMNSYLKLYPHQLGLVLFEYIIMLIVKSKEKMIFIFRIFNLISLICIYYMMYKITKIFQENEKCEMAVAISCMFFFPLTLYILFVYGNLIGLALAMVSLYLLLMFFKSKKKRYVVFSCLFSVVSIIIKNNYLIFFIAEIILLALNIIHDKKYRNIIYIFMFILLYVISGKTVNYIVYKVTSTKVSNGLPKIGWIEMGMQDNSIFAPGWYIEGNIDLFESLNYDEKQFNSIMKKKIKNRVDVFKSNPSIAIKFLYDKVDSQWNETTYESLWVTQTSIILDQQHSFSNNVRDFFNQKNSLGRFYVKYCNVINFIILLGALTYFIINFNKLNIYKISLILVVEGGFLFHILWEAKSQYIFTYFVLLIPYAVIGYNNLLNILIEKKDKRKLLNENN